MDVVQLANRLTSAGFTEYEAKVYLGLLSEHPATGYQVSKTSGVPRSMVYEALGRLHKRGAVLKSEQQRATLYRPVAPETLLDRLSEEHDNLIDGLRQDLAKVYSAHKEERLWTINGGEAVLSYASKMLHGAEREISLVSGDAALSKLKEDIFECCKRSLIVNLLLTGENTFTFQDEAQDLSAHCRYQVAHHPPLESELHELSNMLLVVVDSHECLIANSIQATQEMRATITNNPNLVMIAWQFVWMELFTQRIYNNLGPGFLAQLEPQDRRIFESLDRIR